MGKRVEPFAGAKSARASSDWLKECSRMLSLARPDRVDAAGGAKVFIQRNVARLGGVTYHHKRVPVLDEPPFCFSYKRFSTICKETYQKLARSE